MLISKKNFSSSALYVYCINTLNSNKNYNIAVFWIIAASFISNLDDVIVKLLSVNISFIQIIFFRYFFASLILLPFLKKHQKKCINKKNIIMHLMRIGIGFLSIVLWCWGIKRTSLISVSTLSISTPIFVSLFAFLFLKEKINFFRISGIIFGILSVALVITQYNYNNSTPINSFKVHLNLGALSLLGGVILFALLDILNKKLLKYDSEIRLIYYFSVGITILSFPWMIFTFLPLTFFEITLLFISGLGGNLLLYCLLKAFSLTNLSDLTIFRYSELFFAGILGYIIFNEVISLVNIFSICFIMLSIFLNTIKIKQKKNF